MTASMCSWTLDSCATSLVVFGKGGLGTGAPTAIGAAASAAPTIGWPAARAMPGRTGPLPGLTCGQQRLTVMRSGMTSWMEVVQVLS
jgi:hypothetical protein